MTLTSSNPQLTQFTLVHPCMNCSRTICPMKTRIYTCQNNIDKTLGRVKFPASSGQVLQVRQGIRHFERQLERYSQRKQPRSKRRFLLIKRTWKKVYADPESRMHAWLVDVVPRDIQTKASNRAHTLSARMLIVEYYYTANPGPDTIGFAMSRAIRTPTNTATSGLEVLANIESWKTSIQIDYEVTKTMPSQQEIRAAFQRLISPLKVADDAFKFHQDLTVSQTFETQKVSDDEVLNIFSRRKRRLTRWTHGNSLNSLIRHHHPRRMLSILGMGQPSRKGREIRGLNRFLLLRMMISRRDLHKRRQIRKHGSHWKENHNPSRLLHRNPLRLLYKSSRGKARGGTSAVRTEKKLPGRIKSNACPSRCLQAA